MYPNFLNLKIMFYRDELLEAIRGKGGIQGLRKVN